MGECYRIAIYLRLSKENKDMADESNSITNQRLMLEEFVQKNFEHYELKEFADDGFSGTNFQRPRVTELLRQVRDGEIDCVVVKDFSRFSRDYIELGSYLEQIFPVLGVRFISVNDHYDSKKYRGNTAELDISFKGLMYDLYSKDLSVKVKSSLQTRKEQGQYACANAPFGYTKAKGDRHMLVAAEDEAEIVRRIFSLRLGGETSAGIAKLLNREKIPTPIEFKIKKGQASRKPLGDCFQWNPSMVCSILNNPTYAGDMVYGKYDRDSVGGKNHLKPRSEWKVCKDHHAAIVSRDDFEKVQKMRKQTGSKKARDMGERHPLQGKVYCGGCKRAMTFRKRSLNPYFYCNQRYVYADAKQCVGNMNLMFLEQVILCQIDAAWPGRESLGKIRLEKEHEFQKGMGALLEERAELLRNKAALQRKRLEEYEKAAFGKASNFQAQHIAMHDVEDKIAEIDTDIDRLKKEIPRREDGITGVCNQGCGAELTKELVEALIRKIIVYDESHIEIEWALDAKESATVSHNRK